MYRHSPRTHFVKNTISISEILGTIEDGRVEICAEAEADYHPIKGQVTVDLDAFARHVVSLQGDGRRQVEPWLPLAQRVVETLTREEVASFTKDVFHSWIRQVRAAVPADLCLRT